MSQPDFSSDPTVNFQPETAGVDPTVETMAADPMAAPVMDPTGAAVAPGPGMPAPGAVPGPAVKPKSNVYTVMLFLALVAQGLAITFLCLEMARYKWDIKATEAGSPSAWVAPVQTDVLPG